MDKRAYLTARDLQALLAATVQRTLEESGVLNGWVTYNEAVARWKSAFRLGVAEGKIKPIHTGKSEHAQKRYRIGDIMTYIASQQAETTAIIESIKLEQ